MERKDEMKTFSVNDKSHILYLNIDRFHCAALATITDVQLVWYLYFSMSSNVLISNEPPLAMTGMDRVSAITRCTSMWTGSLDRSCFSL